MIVALDVHYEDPDATAAAVLFASWTDAGPAREVTACVENVAPYEPGAFFRRELPCLRAVLAMIDEPIETIVVDSYVWLGDTDHPGLGAHLYEALERKIPVVGVAKTPFHAMGAAVAITRGQSANPLFVTAVGIDVNDAARSVRAMHGPYRIPTLLARVDRLCRGL